MKKIIRIIVLFLIVLFSMIIKNNSYAQTGFKEFNGSPRMEIIVNAKKFDDAKIVVEDYSGLDDSKIAFYTSKGGTKGDKITSKNFIKKIEPTYSSDKKAIIKYTYTISNEYLNKKNNDFYMSITDKGNPSGILNTSFRIKSDGKKYTVDYAPRAFGWSINNDKFTFTVKDWVGTKYVKIYDLNGENQSKEIFKKENLASGSSAVEVSLKNFKKKNDKYNIKIITQDSNKKNFQIATRIISFGIQTVTKELNITNLDIGVQGDCVLLESKGNNLLMDTGIGWNTDYAKYVRGVTKNENKVIQELKNRNIKKLDIYISHWHQDHYGMIETILKDSYFTIEKIYLPDFTIMDNWKSGLNKNIKYTKLYNNNGQKIDSKETVTYNNYLDAKNVYTTIQSIAKSKKIKIVYLKCGSRFNLGDANISIIGPLNKNNIKKVAGYVNNYSLVAMCTVGKTKFLTAGDIENVTEKDLINSNIDVSADIMKLSHHGNDTSNTINFKKKVNPKYAFYTREDIVSKTGWMSLSPLKNTINNFKSLKTNMYGRASNGNLTISIKNDTITVNPEKNYYTIKIKYIDSSSNKELSAKEYKFHIATHDDTGEKYFTNYYLYDYKKNINGYKYDTEKNKEFKTSGTALNKGQVKELKLYYKK